MHKDKKKKVGFFFRQSAVDGGQKSNAFEAHTHFEGTIASLNKYFYSWINASICECGVKKRYVNFDFETFYISKAHSIENFKVDVFSSQRSHSSL